MVHILHWKSLLNGMKEIIDVEKRNYSECDNDMWLFGKFI